MSTPMSFDELLDIDASDAIKPPTRPGGTYLCTVAIAEQVKSSKKGTPGIQYTFTNFQPQSDVDQDRWSEYVNSPVVDLSTDNMTSTFWLTAKSRFMLKEFAEKCGVNANGRSLRQMSDDVIGAEVLVTVRQTVGDRSTYANIEEFAVAPEE